MNNKESKFTGNQKAVIMGISLFALIVISPQIYAAVEPHITITMDPGQTTKPFQIKDDSGTEVFSVDTDGTISPAPASGVTTVQSLRHIVIGELSETTTEDTDINDQQVLAQWRVDFNSLQDIDSGFNELPYVFITHFWQSGFIKSDTGDFVIMAISESFDDISYTERLTLGAGSTSYEGVNFGEVQNFTFCQRTNISQDECFITMGFYNHLGTGSTGFIRDAIFELGIILPADTTITQVFP